MERHASGHSAHLAAFDLPLGQALAAMGETEEAREIAQKIAALEGSSYASATNELLQQLDGDVESPAGEGDQGNVSECVG